jgi:hypothetical protein
LFDALPDIYSNVASVSANFAAGFANTAVPSGSLIVHLDLKAASLIPAIALRE